MNFSSNDQVLPIDKAIIQDHDKVRALFAEYKKAISAEQKQQLAYTIIRELSMHSAKEEEVVYPLIKKALGDSESKHLLKEHTELKQLLATLGEMHADKDMAAFDAQIAKTEQEFQHHIKDEEEREIPQLISSPGIDAMKVGKEFMDAAAHAVTRPHTWAPDKAPLNKVTNAMTAPLDAAADRIRFGGEPPKVSSQ